MRYYTTEILSENQELTPEGFLLCRNVPIARTGMMLYAAGEGIPIEPVSGIIRVERTPEQVFAPQTMASFEGKAVTFDHPMEDVSPANWSRLAKGVAQNVRRGQGVQNDLLLADLLVTDATSIQAVRDGLREVSCGYEADYEQTAPGHGLQTNIIGNHMALVEKGRCGSRCAIGDKAMKKTKWMDRLRAAFKSRDEAELEAALEESKTKDGEAEETEEEKKKREAAEAAAKTSDSLVKFADALSAIEGRLAKLETRDAEAEETEEEKKQREAAEAAKTGDEAEGNEAKQTEDGEGDEDEKDEKKAADKKARDSAALLAETQDVYARAEILSPGVQLPTRDAAADPAKTRDSLCALRRKALELAFQNPKTRDAVSPLLAGINLSTLTCDALSSTFIGASEIVRRENNAQTKVTFDGGRAAGSIATTIQSLNQRNAQFWNRN